MGFVSKEVESKRATGAVLFIIAMVLGIPVIGPLLGFFFFVPYFGAKIYAVSSTRLNDFGILLAISVAYLVAFALPALLELGLFIMGVLQFIVAWFGLKILLPRIDPLHR